MKYVMTFFDTSVRHRLGNKNPGSFDLHHQAPGYKVLNSDEKKRAPGSHKILIL